MAPARKEHWKKMGAFSTEIRINAPKEKVWGVLADLGGIYKWNPGVSHSPSTPQSSGGRGAARRGGE